MISIKRLVLVIVLGAVGLAAVWMSRNRALPATQLIDNSSSRSQNVRQNSYYEQFKAATECHPINWTHPRYCTSEENGTSASGLLFDVQPSLLQSLGIPLKQYVPIERGNLSDFVFVTAADVAYSDPAMDAIGNVQKHFPNHVIYFYDLSDGRSKESVNKIRNLCHVIYRKFDFSLYPPHVRNLRIYAFKALIVHEILAEFPGVFWMDSSVRFKTNNLSSVLDQVYANRGILTFSRSYHSNFAATHLGMYRYLPISASKASNTEQRDANSIYFYRTEEIYSRIVFWWVLCSLKEDCMASDRQLQCRFKGRDVWAGCHRFDQSAINILMANHFHFDELRYLSSTHVLDVLRGSAHKELLIVCPAPNKEQL